MTTPLIELPIFQGLQNEWIDSIEKFVHRVETLSGDAIIWQGDPAESVFCVLSGEVEIYRLSPGGREQILDRMGPGRCFNLAPALIEFGENQANVRALTNCQLMTLSSRDLNRLMLEYPGIGLNVARYFAERLVHMSDLVETLSLYSVRQRLARFLIEQANADENLSAVLWTQTEIASRLGTVRDVMGRALRRMAEEGLLRMEREKILLLDREGLEKAALGEQ